MALNMALSRIKKMPLALSIYADFDYLAAGFTQGWVDQWGLSSKVCKFFFTPLSAA